MNSPKKFLLEKLNKLVAQFDDIRGRYEYQDPSDAHYLEVIPSDLFFNSDDLRYALSDILEEFIKKYPFESLVFLTEGEGIELENPEFEVVGVNFTNPLACWYNSDLFNENDSLELNLIHAGGNNYSLAA